MYQVCTCRWSVEDVKREQREQREQREEVCLSRRMNTKSRRKKNEYLFEYLVYWLECSSLFLIQCHSLSSTVNDVPLLYHKHTHTHTHSLVTAPYSISALGPQSLSLPAVLWGSSQTRWRRAAAAAATQHVSDRLLIRQCCMIFWSRLHLAPSASNHLTVSYWCHRGSEGKRAVCRCKGDTERRRVQSKRWEGIEWGHQ